MASESEARPPGPAETLHFAEGAPDAVIDPGRASSLVDGLLRTLGPLRRVLLVAPDYTRRHSGAGELASLVYRKLQATAEVEILIALGTHRPMSATELSDMYVGIPHERFRMHSFRHDLATLGDVPASFVRQVSGGRLDGPIRCEVSAQLVRGRYDRILSVGQLVPHEVAGIAGHSKNVFIGAGGKTVIDRTHFLGAVCGIENTLGRADTPVRRVLSYMARELAAELPITYLLGVRQRLASGRVVTRGLFAGEGEPSFRAGAKLVERCNIERLATAPHKIVVYLAPDEYRSTWLGNKAIYRTRLALADAGELVVIAPGVQTFGEDPDIDRLIRRHGYHGTPHVLARIDGDPELAASLSAAAHLIHGSTEGRFRVRYAAGGLSARAIHAAGFEPADLADCLSRYAPARMREGDNLLPDGERVFFIGNPSLGLWAKRGESELPADCP